MTATATNEARQAVTVMAAALPWIGGRMQENRSLFFDPHSH